MRDRPLRERLLCIGHRGAKGREPENTLRSVRKAIQLGADAVEVDVHWVDGRLIVLHDARLERTTNGRGRAARRNFPYLRSLDAGKGEKIPTLEEVFDTVDRRVWVNIELKGKNTALPVAALIDTYARTRGWRYSDFLVSSFRGTELRKIIGRGIPLGILFNRPPRGLLVKASRLGAYSVHGNRKHLTPNVVERARLGGLKVFAYTVNTANDMRRMQLMGVDGVFTDYPGRHP